MFRKKPEEIEAWVNIKGVIVPLTLYGNIREEKEFCQHIVEIKEASYIINNELLIIRNGPSDEEFERVVLAMREFEREVEK